MACCTGGETLISELQALANQIGDCSNTIPCCPEPSCDQCCQPCCFPPCTVPFAQVTMTCPPPIMAPTVPQPVKPLSLPCPPSTDPTLLTPDEEERSRYNNFYNNYNVDYHLPYCPPPTPKVERCCEDYTKGNEECCPDPGCPTGFKPCTMKLTPPPGCDPCGVWCAEIQPCPPKPKKKGGKYVPGPCTRPCCKHWKPKEGPCLYDDPCKAHCYNHPPGIKPSGRWP